MAWAMYCTSVNTVKPDIPRTDPASPTVL